MFKIQIKARVKSGHLNIDSQKFISLVAQCDDGEYILSLEKIQEPKSIEEYRAHYFAMRDIVADETGNTKKDIHMYAKNHLLGGDSTTTLDENEWKEFIKEFKSWSYEQFNIYL